MNLTRRILLKATAGLAASGLILPGGVEAEELLEAPRKWWFLDKRMSERPLTLRILPARGGFGLMMAVWDESVMTRGELVPMPDGEQTIEATNSLTVFPGREPMPLHGIGVRTAEGKLASAIRYYGGKDPNGVEAAVKQARFDSGYARVLVSIDGGKAREYPLD